MFHIIIIQNYINNVRLTILSLFVFFFPFFPLLLFFILPFDCSNSSVSELNVSEMNYIEAEIYEQRLERELTGVRPFFIHFTPETILIDKFNLGDVDFDCDFEYEKDDDSNEEKEVFVHTEEELLAIALLFVFALGSLYYFLNF